MRVSCPGEKVVRGSSEDKPSGVCGQRRDVAHFRLKLLKRDAIGKKEQIQANPVTLQFVLQLLGRDHAVVILAISDGVNRVAFLIRFEHFVSSGNGVKQRSGPVRCRARCCADSRQPIHDCRAALAKSEGLLNLR